MDQDERRDIELDRLFGEQMALEVAVTALLQAHPQPLLIRKHWQDAEDLGFTWTSETEGVPEPRLRRVQEAYVAALKRLRPHVP